MNTIYQKEFSTEGNDCIIRYSYCVLYTLGRYVAISLRRYYGGPHENIMVNFVQEFDTEQEAVEFVDEMSEEDE